MKSDHWSVTVPGKWILAGEHSVLRGMSALAFPYPQFQLSLEYQSVQTLLEIQANGHESEVQRLITRGAEWLKVPLANFDQGKIKITSTIPIGSGLGSSAALCVAASRFVLWKSGQSVDRHREIALATHLEDLFHGKSSGLDVSVIAENRPLLFSIENRGIGIEMPLKFPRVELIDTGMRGKTIDCIARVKAWQSQYALRAADVDQKMNEATLVAKSALESFDRNPVSAQSQLVMAMGHAQECLEEWGLVPDQLLTQKSEFIKKGALAVKLTGAGLGGFWSVLWPT